MVSRLNFGYRIVYKNYYKKMRCLLEKKHSYYITHRRLMIKLLLQHKKFVGMISRVYYDTIVYKMVIKKIFCKKRNIDLLLELL